MQIKEVPANWLLRRYFLLYDALAIYKQGQLISLVPLKNFLCLQGLLAKSGEHHCLRKLSVESLLLLIEQLQVVILLELECFCLNVLCACELLDERAIVVQQHQHEVEEVLLDLVDKLEPLFLSGFVLLTLQLLLR